MKECYLYKKLKNNAVQCQNCAHYCIIEPGKKGKCWVRQNQEGVLYSLNYGQACALNLDPIEKKPLFHFLPGTQTLSLAAEGCNFQCHSCQNWRISQGPRLGWGISGQAIAPQEIVQKAEQQNIPSISYTYTEPAIFSEYALDTMKLARKRGIKNIWVSNGFWSKQLFDEILAYLDAANIDLKSFRNHFYEKYCGARLQPVLDTLKRLKRAGTWVEVTTLVIPGLNDSEAEFMDIAKFIRNELGQETPWHISRFSGSISWKLQHLPETPNSTLEKAYRIADNVGLNYIYIGNLSNTNKQNTKCPKCQAIIVQRDAFYNIKTHYDENGKCPKCGYKVITHLQKPKSNL